MFYIDWTYIILVMPAVIFATWASMRVNTTFEKYSRQLSARRMTGAEAARRVLSANGIYDVQIMKIKGNLTDHYDPRANVIRLSEAVHDGISTAAIGVAAHEAGARRTARAELRPCKDKIGYRADNKRRLKALYTAYSLRHNALISRTYLLLYCLRRSCRLWTLRGISACHPSDRVQCKQPRACRYRAVRNTEYGRDKGLKKGSFCRRSHLRCRSRGNSYAVSSSVPYSRRIKQQKKIKATTIIKIKSAINKVSRLWQIFCLEL